MPVPNKKSILNRGLISENRFCFSLQVLVFFLNSINSHQRAAYEKEALHFIIDDEAV